MKKIKSNKTKNTFLIKNKNKKTRAYFLNKGCFLKSLKQVINILERLPEGTARM